MTLAVPTGLSSYVWSAVLVVLLPLALTAAALRATTGSFLGAEARTVALLVYALIVTLGVGLLASLKRSDVQITDGKLILRGSLYTRSIPLADIDPSTVVVHAEKERPPLAMRTNGIGLPGYSAGWFRTRDGARAFVVYGGGRHISFRTRDGVMHVVGAADGERLKAEISPA